MYQSTQANKFPGSIAVCLMTSLTPNLHIVSQASGSHSGRTPGASPVLFFFSSHFPRFLAGSGRITCCYHGSICRTHQFVPLLSLGDDPSLFFFVLLWLQSRAPRLDLICIPLSSGAGSEGEGRTSRGTTCCNPAIWTLFLPRPQIKTQPALR